MAWLTGWGKRYPITLSDTSVTSRLVKITITDPAVLANAKRNGEDVRVYDDTTGLECKHVVLRWDRRNSYAQIMCLVATGTNTHYLYVSNAAATTSADRTILTNGTDFSLGTTGVQTATASAGTVAAKSAATGITDSRYHELFRRYELPIITPPAGKVYCRDASILSDATGSLTLENGNVVTFFGALNTATPAIGDIYYATSADGGKTYGAATLVVEHGGTYDGSLCIQPVVIKFGPTDYRMWYTGRTGTDVADYKILYATATSYAGPWTKNATPCVQVSDFVGKGALAVPHVIQRLDGSFLMVLETPLSATPTEFEISAATSPTGIPGSWVVANSGNAIFTKTGGAAWEAAGVANPKIYEFAADDLLLQYNGAHIVTTRTFDVGFARGSTLTGLARLTANPMFVGIPDSYGVETCAYSYINNKDDILHYHQWFTGTGSDFSTARICYSEQLAQKGALLKTMADTDAAFIGCTLPAGSFVWETCLYQTTHGSNPGGSEYIAAIYDMAAFPAAGASTAFSAAKRITVQRDTFLHATTPSDVMITYVNPSDVLYYWTGSAWSTTVTRIAVNTFRGIKCTSADDGTNFVITLKTELDVAIATASIAKSGVKSFSSGRQLVTGVPFTNTWFSGQYAEYYAVTPYNATEPATTLGAEESAATGDPQTITRCFGSGFGFGFGL